MRSAFSFIIPCFKKTPTEEPSLKTLSRLLLLFIFFILTGTLRIHPAYSQADSPSPQILPSKTFGCLLPLSGQYKIVGEKVLEGILAAAESMPPGGEYRIVVKDIGDSDAMLRGALASLTKIEDLSFIVGPIPSKFIPVVSPVVNSKKIPTVVFPVSEHESGGGPYVVKFYYPVEEQARVLASYAVKELGVKSYAVLYPDTSFGNRMKDEFIKSLRANGGNTVYEGSYDAKDRDLEEEVMWIASEKPEGIFIADGASASSEIIIQLKKKGGLSDILFLGPSTWNGQLFLELTGEEIDGFVYRAIFTDFFYYSGDEWEGFLERFRDKFKKEPSFLEYQSYLATKLVLSVASLDVTGKGLVQKLAALGNDPDYMVKRERNGSVRISPRYLILSVADGELSEINVVR